jgi:hypothetical protein
MAPNEARTMENDVRNPGPAPIDDAADKNRAGNEHEPDRTSGRLPAQAEKIPPRREKKQR